MKVSVHRNSRTLKTKDRRVAVQPVQSAAGFTLVELLVSIALMSLAVTAVMVNFSDSVSQARDHQIRLETFVEAQAIAQTMLGELRMAGNGVPFDQTNFRFLGSQLSDPTVAQPILVASATATSISFRLNETGDIMLLASPVPFEPSSSLVVSLTDVSQLGVNDPIYISNSVVSGDEGFYGTVASVDNGAKTVTLQAGYVTTAGATFAMGSILEEVPVVTYSNTADGITRDSGLGAVLLGSNAAMSLEYLDYAGNVMSLPMTAEHLRDLLRSIRVTVTKRSNRRMSDGNYHSISVVQTAAVRNLNLYY